MLVFRELKKNLLESSALALGFFDGVHQGHQKVILNAVKKAQELGTANAIVTFSKHPRHVLSKSSSTSMLISLEERLELFESLGVQAAVVLDFDENFAKITAKEYLENILIGCLNAKSITIGYNHKFGQQNCKLNCIEKYDNNHGNSKFLEEYSKQYGFEVNIISPVKIENHIVSSSIIRKFILNGELESAARFLGRPFKIKGSVIHGNHLGRTLGFPTANFSISEELIIPLNGVYSGLVKIDAKVYHAVINVGKRPTISTLEKPIIEAHILNFDKDIYGKIIEVSFLKRLRNEIKFNSLGELKTQIYKDCELVHSENRITKK